MEVCSIWDRMWTGQDGPKQEEWFASPFPPPEYHVPTAPQLGTPGGRLPVLSCRLWQARASCLRLFWQLMRAAASRTFCTAGSSRPIRIAMIAITTNSSMRVKADLCARPRPRAAETANAAEARRGARTERVG